MTVIIGVVIGASFLDEVSTRLAEIKSVSEVYKVTGEYDVFLKALLKDREDLNQITRTILAIPNIKKTYTMTVLDSVKDTKDVI